ncbi:MAG: superoxide dismutase [Pseudonocardiaceae bacterium]
MPTPSAGNPGGPVPTVSPFGSGTLTTPNPTSKAITYDPDLAPVGAAVTAALIPSSEGSTTAVFTVSRLLPNRSYAVHAHTTACGATGEAAGPHFQNRMDPAATPQAPSSDPEFANPRNEIWLDVHTDAVGAGTSRTTVPFALTDRVPGSIVVHEAMQTATGPGQAGKAGARIACLTLSGR